MPIRVLMVVLMMATAASLGLIAYQLGKRPGSPSVPTARSAATATYLVAARPLPPGTLVRNEDFTPRSAPGDTMPAGAIIDSPEARTEIRSALVRRYLEPGTAVTRADIIRPHDRGFLAAVLAPDTRAVSIAVNAVTGVAGLISPGDHVDVILTQEIAQRSGHTEHLVTSETVLANALVIAVDQDITQGAPTTGAPATRPASTVTIQTTVDQAERVAVATRLGGLSLAVRSSGADNPNSKPAGTAVSSADVSQSLAKATISDGYRVEVIQGGARSEVMFK
jgi:pilus assembly protein CpaB